MDAAAATAYDTSMRMLALGARVVVVATGVVAGALVALVTLLSF